MPPSEIYVCDADCLINLHRHFGRRAIKALRRVGKARGLKLPEGVIRELLRGTDKLARFAERETGSICVEATSHRELRSEIVRIDGRYGESIEFGQRRYGGFWKSKAGREAADAQVVAVAKTIHAIAVSDDQAVKFACALEGVPCIGWSEFARRLGLIKPEQLNLNFGDAGAVDESGTRLEKAKSV